MQRDGLARTIHSRRLNGILDGQPLCIPENGGELVVPHPMFRFAATANSNGGSDETGLYQGVLRQNLALMDRFVLCEVTIPEPKPKNYCWKKRLRNSRMVFAKRWWNTPMKYEGCLWGESGNSYHTGSIELTFSTRSLLRC